jgi:multicomponent Na+:H+ antiporter subunit E
MAWSGLFKPLLLGLGILSCLLTFLIVRRMGYFNEEIFPPRFSYGLRLVGYWFWLGREIFRSGLDVTRVILDPKMPISPREVTITANPPSSMDQVIFANSITLTPGTLALDLHNGVIKVHCLTEDGAKQLLDGEMDRRVTELSSR